MPIKSFKGKRTLPDLRSYRPLKTSLVEVSKNKEYAHLFLRGAGEWVEGDQALFFIAGGSPVRVLLSEYQHILLTYSTTSLPPMPSLKALFGSTMKSLILSME